MECHRESGFHVANIVGSQSGNPVNSGNENCGAKDGMCEKDMSVHTKLTSNCNERAFQFDVESEPPTKRAKNDLLEDLTTFDQKKVLYKTRMCFQFRAGSCPFNENCEFAHSPEELRELPQNWQENLATHKEEQMELSEQPREVFQVPAMSSNELTYRPNVRQHCKAFLSRFGCQYGENCLLIHDEYYMERKSAAICLLPGTDSELESNGSRLTSNASNWKRRLCNKWESTGICAYGRNCFFAHGFAELHHYGGWRGKEGGIGSSAFGANQAAALPARASVGAVGAPASRVPYSYHIGAPARRLPAEIPRTGDIPIRRWKGPDKISKIYGDWIDDLE